MTATRRFAGLAGVLALAVALGVGQLVSGFLRPAAAPAIAVGDRLIVLTPEPVKRWAIRNLGTNDKQTLVLGVYLTLFLLALAVGRLAVRRVAFGVAGIGLLAVVGVYCALTAPGSKFSDIWPNVIGPLVGAAVLVRLMHQLAADDAAPPGTGQGGPGRRNFLRGAALTTVGAGAATLAGRGIASARSDVSRVRAKLVLPAPASPAPALAAGTDLGQTSVPWQTSASAFYRIDTALAAPQIEPQHWSLRIHGMVDREMTVTWDQLLARPLIERWITLCCVSNDVGGNLISNAKWLGAPLADLLREAGVHSGADQLLLTSRDGMTIGAPTAVVLDGRDAMLAIGMNGAPLPIPHGFPVRVVVPGLYGYVSACKWVVDIEATTFAARRAYWVQGGWAQQTDIKLESRIDTPRNGGQVRAGQPVAVAGVAWDQHVGVSAVEVQVDDGPWQPTRLAEVPSTDTWRQWVFTWTPPKAQSYLLRVRATDASGQVQTGQGHDVFPSGATGWHTITVRAT